MAKSGFTRPLIRYKEVMSMDIAIARDSAVHILTHHVVHDLS